MNFFGKAAKAMAERLTWKTLIWLVCAFTLTSCLLALLLVRTMDKRVNDIYDDEITSCNESAQNICNFLSASGGDTQMLADYVQAEHICCTVTSEDGTVLFENLPQEEGKLTVAGEQKSAVVAGKTLRVRGWSDLVGASQLTGILNRTLRHGFVLYFILLFLLVAGIVYGLLLLPISKLRGMLTDYSLSGTLPPHSWRRDALGRLQNSFADLAVLLAQKEEDAHRMIASLSHDIRTPLTSVMGCTERLLTAELSPEKRQSYLKAVYDKAYAIKSILDEFDEYIKTGSDSAVAMEPMYVCELCSLLREEYQQELSEAGVDFSVRCRCQDEQILCNYDRMRRLFGNLVSNSLEHAGKPHPTLTLACEAAGDKIVFAFSDDGCGVPPEILPRIFDSFFTTDRKKAVSGLGLSICRSIVLGHGGAISAANRPEGGLTVRIVLPRLTDLRKGLTSPPERAAARSIQKGEQKNG